MKAKRERRRRKEEIRKNKEVEGKGDRRNKMGRSKIVKKAKGVGDVEKNNVF